MPHCPNCNFELVLLEHRRKYKCAKCGKLFSQKKIEIRDFQNWNKKQRELNKERIEQELNNKKPKLSEEEKKQRVKESAKRWNENNKEKIRLNKARYYKENRDKILAQKKKYRKRTRQRENKKRKERRHQDMENTRHLSRIYFWRQKQKELVLQYIENEFCNILR